MYDVAKENNVQFLRAAVDLLQKKLLIAEKKNIELALAQQADADICKSLAEDLLLLRQKFYRPRREKIAKDKPKAAVNRIRLPHNRPPADCPEPEAIQLVSEEVVHTTDVQSCCCSGDLTAMSGGFESSCEIDVTQYRYKLVTHKRQKYKCGKCQKITTARGAPKLKDGSEFSIQMAAEVAADKYQHHIPLNRQVQQMAKHGINVDAKTLFRLTEHLHERLLPIPSMIRNEILSRPSVGIDEAPMRILSTDQSGFVWVIANNYGSYYQYEMTRSGKVAQEILKGFKGTVMCDGYKGYDYLKTSPGVVYAQCWAHCRRNFYNAIDMHPEATKAVELIDRLFDIDRKATDFDDLARLRHQESTAVIAEFESYLDSRKGKYLDSLGFGKAVNYYRERRDSLHRFLSDSMIPLDNNSAERSLRGPVMGRNNFQGFRTINGADVAMTFYSIVASCKAVNVDPRNYMLVMGFRAARGETLLTPYQWATQIEQEAISVVATAVPSLHLPH